MPTPKLTKESLNRRQRDYMVASNDATIVRIPGIPQRPINPHLTERGVAGARAHRAWEEAHPIASTLGKVAGAIPLAVAAYPIVAGLGLPAAGKAATTASKVATGASRAFPQVTRHLMTSSAPKAAMMQTAGGQSIAVPLTTTMRFPWQGIGYGTAATGLSLGSGMRSLAESASLADAAEATPAESSTDTVGMTFAPPPENKPNQEKPDKLKPEDKKNKGIKDLIWERSGTPSKSHPNFWRNARNWGIRVPLYTGVGAAGFDVVGNVLGASAEPDSVVHKWTFPAMRKRFALERGLIKLGGDAYRTDKQTPTNNVILQSSEAPQPSMETDSTYADGTFKPRPASSLVYNPEQTDSIIKVFFGQ